MDSAGAAANVGVGVGSWLSLRAATPIPEMIGTVKPGSASMLLEIGFANVVKRVSSVDMNLEVRRVVEIEGVAETGTEDVAEAFG